MASYVDVEALLVAWLKTAVGFVNVVTEYPTNAVFAMPLVVVERFGGSDATWTIDTARVDIDVYAADRVSAKAQAEKIRQAIRIQLPRYVWNGTVVASTATISAPSHAPYDSRLAVRRMTAAYELRLHQFTGV